MAFSLANNFGYLLHEDPKTPTFGAGPLNDILIIEGSPVVASSKSGLWLPGFDSPSASLSLDWDRADMNCLVKGPVDAAHPTHLYAGGSGPGGEALWENIGTGGFNKWRRIPIQDAARNLLNSGTIWDMTVAGGILVLACDNGLYWAEIPRGFSGTYSFQIAVDTTGNALRGFFSGVKSNILGESVIVVAAQPADAGGFGRGLVQAVRRTGDLVFEACTLPAGIVISNMGQTALTSCQGASGVFYAASADPSGNVGFVLVSHAVGSTIQWIRTTSRVAHSSDFLFGGSGKLAGTLLGRNSRIGLLVSPSDPNLVLLGWQLAYFILNGSGDWIRIDASTGHLHTGIHAFSFGSAGPLSNEIHICSDGGVAVTPDFGQTHVSFLNQNLPNLEITKAAVHYQNYGIVAGSFPRYGNLYCSIYPVPHEWRFIHGGDGQSVSFLRNGQLIDQSTNFEAPVSAVGIQERRFDVFAKPLQWSQALGLIRTNAPVAAPINAQVTLLPDGMRLLVPLEPVETPTWRNNVHTTDTPQDLFGTSLVGVAAFSTGIYGLWHGRDDSKMWWNLLGTIPSTALPENILCLGSNDGSEIFIGTDNGLIHALTPPTAPGSSWNHQISLFVGSVPDKILQFCIHSGQPLFAIASSNGRGRIYQSAGLGAVWEEISGPTTDQYTAIECDWSPISPPKTLFVSTDTKVFSSIDQGITWVDISDGLPKSPHITDLRFVREPAGASYLYVSTYGWSIWRRILDPGIGRSRNISIGGPPSAIGIRNDRNGQTDDAIDLLSNIVQPLFPVQELSERVDNGVGSDDLWGVLSVRFELQADGSVLVKWITVANNAWDGSTNQQRGNFMLGPGEQTYQTIELDNVSHSIGFDWNTNN